MTSTRSKLHVNYCEILNVEDADQSNVEDADQDQTNPPPAASAGIAFCDTKKRGRPKRSYSHEYE